ncbi:hypothetical protein QTP88_008669 [Uroleucon formosanum]
MIKRCGGCVSCGVDRVYFEYLWVQEFRIGDRIEFSMKKIVIIINNEEKMVFMIDGGDDVLS